MSSGNGSKKVEVFVVMTDTLVQAWLERELVKMPYVITGIFSTHKAGCDGLRSLAKKPQVIITDLVDVNQLTALQGIVQECGLPMVPFVLLSVDSRGKLLKNSLPPFVLGRCLFQPMPTQLSLIITQAVQSCDELVRLHAALKDLEAKKNEDHIINAAKLILMRRWPFFTEDMAHQYVVRVANQRHRKPVEQAEAFIKAEAEFLITGKDTKYFFPR